MNDLVVLAHRILKPLSSYYAFDEGSNGALSHLERLPLQQGEVPLGIYKNTPENFRDAILVTDLGLHRQQGDGWLFVGYEQIDFIDPPGDKLTADGLSVHLLTHDILWLPVRGGHDRFRDVFEFLRFLERARSLYAIPEAPELTIHT